ncbi:MAG: NADH-quinone oxidoreductase subunit L [Rubrivivax sp.]
MTPSSPCTHRMTPASVNPRLDAAIWRAARAASLLPIGIALAAVVAVALGHRGVAFGLRLDPLGAVMLLLVAFIGWVIVRYSRDYLGGQAGQSRYAGWLMGTLAAVASVAVADNLALLALAWIAASLCVHRLLTFFRDRAPARVAAHKKFVVARAADVCMVAAVALLAAGYGTLQLSAITAQVAVGTLPLAAPVQLAIGLVALAALLKCAQLPVHGWLIQVMEAPTPVSALLHAGVVNLGGFVLMRFAPLVAEVPAAQVLLVLVGSATAVLAALVMSTRISIKVMLAWSTSAQMGFMLMQCGLGAWGLALLHLLAHSLYKAHAFLSAGAIVQAHAEWVQAPPRAPLKAPALIAGLLLSLVMVAAAGWLWSPLPGSAGLATALPGASVPWLLSAIVAVSLVPLLQARAGAGWLLPGMWSGLGAFGVASLYFLLHAASASFGVITADPPAWLLLWVGLLFAALFAVQSCVALAPRGAVARRLYPWFYGGLFLDECFTRLLLRNDRPVDSSRATQRKS